MIRIMHLFLVTFFVLFVSVEEAKSQSQCKQIPKCSDLGYIKTEEECRSSGVPYIKCPFDMSKVYCTEDCSSYELDECDGTIGVCIQCSLNGKWKYESCKTGYMLSAGKCIDNDCEKDFVSGTPNLTVAKAEQIEYCWRGNMKLFRYSGCKDGWSLQGNHTCLANVCEDKYLPVETCPEGATCSDICYEGTVKKADIICDSSQGLRLQPSGDISGETYKCREHPIGNIVFYCKEGRLEGQIISLAADDYDIHPIGCEPIGVVFNNDGGQTKIVGLKNIRPKGSAPYTAYEDDISAGNYNTAWSNCNTCDLSYFNNDKVNNEVLAREFYPDGKTNTDAIIAWATDNGYVAQAAMATRLYSPRLDNDDSKTICPEGSICGKGNWYLPSLAELWDLYNRNNATSRKVNQAFVTIKEKGVGFPITTSSYYWSSTE